MAVPPLAVVEKLKRFPFDYSQLPSDAADKARQVAAAINRSAANYVRVIGLQLVEAKSILPHGAFMPWAETELGMSARTAQNYMAAARFLADKPEPVSYLPAKVIYALAAPTTPAAVVEQIVAEAQAGTLPEGEVIAHRIALAQAEEQEVKRLVASKLGRSQDKARKIVARQKRNRAQECEEQRIAAEARQHESAERVAAMKATISRLVVGSHDVMADVYTALADDPFRFRDALQEALEGGGK